MKCILLAVFFLFAISAGCSAPQRFILPENLLLIADGDAPDRDAAPPARADDTEKKADEEKSPAEKPEASKAGPGYPHRGFILAYMGQKAMDDNLWGDISIIGGGIYGAAKIADYFLVDGGLVSSSRGKELILGGRYLEEAHIGLVEYKFGFRYMPEVTEWFFPFVRAGASITFASYSSELIDPASPVMDIPEYVDVKITAGLEIGAGINISIGNFMMEAALNYGMMHVRFEPEIREEHEFYALFSTWPYKYDRGRFDIGGKPSLYIGIGVSF
ncbi:MAG: hypothetical protein E3J72_07745 [Planctomycetota bacterium]|nr:MAG: hypothetical protein E3J72_07745 [Planctomycetota bacterium]